ncbi:type VII secretion protein EsaA [Vagococcus sp. BWB3-3]|uniref:Type VII secretion system accessory factor EsaA n=1 Tax=Vagococcus allomyrinae TaxID=2794353 RepID=A0A940P7E2_9ENTE|nr:type VII secretion protein EsaA [Vagococcus allomyrinae]
MNKKKFFSGVKIILSISILLFLFIQLNREVQQSEQLQEKQAKEEIKLNVALVNEDEGTMLGEQEIQLAANYIKKIEKDEAHNYYVVSRGIAENGLKNDKYQLMIIIPSNFSNKLLSIQESNPEKLNINYKINSNGNAEIENESNKVGTKIVSDLDKQLVDMYTASVLDNLYSAQVNIGKVAKNQEEYVANYKNNVFQPAVDFQNYLPALVSQSSSASDSNDLLTKTLESYTDSYGSFMESQKSYDTQLEELLAKRAEDKLTYEEFLVALSEMDTTILSNETDAMYQELRTLDIFYQTNLGNNLTQDALITQVGDIKQNFMAVPNEGETPATEDLSLVKQIEKGKQRLDVDEATIKARFTEQMLTYFFGGNSSGNEGEEAKKLTLKTLFEADETGIKSAAANEEIKDIINAYKNFKREQHDKETNSQAQSLLDLEEIYKTLPFDQVPPITGSQLTVEERTELDNAINQINLKIAEIEEKTGEPFPRDYDADYLGVLETSLADYDEISGPSSSLLDGEYELMFTIPGYEGVTGYLSFPPYVTITSMEVGPAYTPVTDPVNFKFVLVDPIKPTEVDVRVKYKLTDLPAIIDASANTADEISILFRLSSSAIDPAFGYDTVVSAKMPVDYSVVHSTEYLSALATASAEKAKLLELYRKVQLVFDTVVVDKIDDTISEELFTEELFNQSVYSMMEDLIYYCFKEEFAEQLKVFQYLEAKAGSISQQFGSLDVRLGEINQNTLALQKNVSSQLDNLEQIRTLLSTVQSSESKVSSVNESTDMSISANRETMASLLETSQGIKEYSESNIKESESVKDVFTQFNTEVETAEQTSKDLADNANSVLDKFEEELANNNNFYGTFATVMSQAQKDGVPNETFLKFLANPITATQESTVKSAEVYKPFTWILMLFAVSLFTAYAFATQNLGERVKQLFERDRLWISDNILNTVFVIVSGVTLGLIFSVLSEKALGISQEETLLWGVVITAIMLIFTLLNHFLIKQLKIFGLAISLFLLTSYVFLTSAVGKTSALNEFGAFVKTINPLSQSETILMNFFSKQSISGFTMVLLALVILVGIILNLVIWHSRKGKQEAPE